MIGKRFAVSLLAFALVVSLLPIFESNAQGEMANSIRVSVVAGSMQETMSKLVKKYKEVNPDVEVTLELEPEGGAFQALIAAGNQPDLIITSLGPQLGTLVAQNAAVNLDDLEGAADLFARLEPASLQKIAGHHYYVPIGADITLMIYNKELFKEAGLDPEKPPATWEEFLTAAETISKLPKRSNGDQVYGTVFWNEALQWGGWYWNMLQPIYLTSNQGNCQLLNALGTDIVFEREECGMTNFFTFVKAAQAFAPPTMEKNFFSRSVGMWLQYGYSWEPNLKSALDTPMVIGKDVGVAPIPAPKEGDKSFSTLGGRALMILKTAPEREARAWHFLQFMMEDANNYQFITELGYLPVVTALKDDEFFKDTGRQLFVTQIANSLIPEQSAAAEKVASAIQGIYQDVVIQTKISLDMAVAEAAAAARRALKGE